MATKRSSSDDADDPTDVLDARKVRAPGATQITDLPGDATDPDPVPGALVPHDAVLVKLDGVVGPFSVMESDFLDAVDGKRTLADVARVLALNMRGAKRIASALLARGTIEMR